MKIMINYDFFDRIKSVNNSDSRLTLVKVRTRQWIKKDLPFLTIINSILVYPHYSQLPIYLMIDYLCYTIFSDIAVKLTKDDIVYNKEIKKYKNQLVLLASQLYDINVDTNYNLLLETELYHKEYKLVRNGLFPDVLEKKYYYIPAYNRTGDIEPVSVEQEHIVGSRQYVLTLGTPTKAPSLAFSSI